MKMMEKIKVPFMIMGKNLNSMNETIVNFDLKKSRKYRYN